MYVDEPWGSSFGQVLKHVSHTNGYCYCPGHHEVKRKSYIWVDDPE